MKKLRQSIIALQVVLCSAVLINVPPVLGQQQSAQLGKKTPQDSVILKSNELLERELAGGQTHVYRVALKANEFLQVRVEQKGVDIELLFFAPGGKELAKVDSPNGTQGFEILTFIAADAGVYTAKVGSLEANAAKGNYTILLETLRVATEKDKKTLQAKAVFDEAVALFNQTTAESYRAAREKFLAASQLYREISDKSGEAESLVGVGFILDNLGERQKALEYYNQALPLFQAVSDKSGEATTLNNVGMIYFNLGEKQKAFGYYNQSLPLFRAVKDKQGEATTLNNIGAAHYALGEKQKALEFYGQSLPLSRSVDDKQQEAKTLNNIGIVYSDLGEKDKALQFFSQSLPLSRAIGDKAQEATTLNNIGAVYDALGEKQKALEFFNQSLPLSRLVADKSREAATLNNIGLAYDALNEKEKALQFYNQSLPLLRAVGDKQGEATTLNNIGLVCSNSGEKQKALEFFNQSLPLSRAVRDKTQEAKTLGNIGIVYSDLGEKDKALQFYNQSLLLLRAVGDISGEAVILSGLMVLYNFPDTARLAIVFGKQSVNSYQQLRANIKSLDKSVQQTYLKSVEKTYRRLAEILVKQGRLPEAEQVLEMLKEEEYFQFVRRDDKVAKDLLTRISLSPTEKDALERYDKIADEITKLGDEFAKLEQKRVNLPAEQTASIVVQQDAINRKLEDARKTLQVFLEELKKEFSREDKRIASVEEGLQAAVKGWNEPNTVVISTIVGEKSLSIIVTTADIQRAHIVDRIGSEPFGEERLNKLVSEFRTAATDPRSDVRLAGQKLYDVLIRPLEKDLNGVKAKTLVWSLDGNLRYAPIAALWDKNKGYLAQNYANVIITLASRDHLALQANGKNNMQALGVGVSKSVAGFSPLENVPEELEAIVGEQSRGGEAPPTGKKTGVMLGRTLLDEQFTYDAFRNQLGRFPVVHAATHFKFVSGTRDEALNSFLLLGNGEKLTLEQIQNAGTIFNGVQLLTLSACNTASGGKDADGREIEGFGAMAQKKGAKAVMATLWAVADESTRELMVEFYRLYQKPELTKAEALRQAQLTLLKDEKFAHPYFWSPFILIGNWK